MRPPRSTLRTTSSPWPIYRPSSIARSPLPSRHRLAHAPHPIHGVRTPIRNPATAEGPRYATHKGFFYGEDVTIADWTIETGDLPRYP